MTHRFTSGAMLRHANAELRRTPNAEQTIGMPIGQMRHWSVEDVLALPDDGNRYEVVDGSLLCDGPAPKPLLAIEVLSPATARNDRLTKRPRIQRSGIECWLVDIDARRVEQWAPTAESPVVCTDYVTWAPAGAAEAFRMALAPIWAEIGG